MSDVPTEESHDVDRVQTAVVIAGHTGDIDVARSHLSHPHGPVRASALNALERLQVLDDATLAAFVDDPDPEVRRRVAQIAARHPDVDLLALLHDAETLVVEMAAWSCGEQVSDDHINDDDVNDDHDDAPSIDVRGDVLACLIDLATSHEDPLVREAAVASLGAIGDERGLPAILAGCADKPAIRRRAVLALAPFAGTHVDAALRRALEDRDWQVRQAAEDILGPAVESVRQSLDDQDDAEGDEEN